MSTLKEARIILPEMSNTGVSLAEVHKLLADRLVGEFQGYTSFRGFGGWADGEGVTRAEAVAIYDIAIPIDEDRPLEHASNWARRDLVALCEWLQKTAQQDTVYLRLPDGEVLFI